MIKINFKQPKYIFPLVIFVPLCALVYFVMQKVFFTPAVCGWSI